MLSLPLVFIQTSPFAIETHRTMARLPLLLALFLSAHIVKTFAMEKSALYRSPTGYLSFGNFKRNSFHYLWVKNITWSMVVRHSECTLLCVAEPKCYSLNMAAYPDSKGLYLCELLATDKYRATKKFHANATFHHYSPWVRPNYMIMIFSLHFLISVSSSHL